MTPQTWWYLEELKRKTSALESDRDRVERLLRRSPDLPTHRRLERELEDIEMRLQKAQRGLLF